MTLARELDDRLKQFWLDNEPFDGEAFAKLAIDTLRPQLTSAILDNTLPEDRDATHYAVDLAFATIEARPN